MLLKMNFAIVWTFLFSISLLAAFPGEGPGKTTRNLHLSLFVFISCCSCLKGEEIRENSLVTCCATMLHFKWKSEALLPVPYYRRFVLQAAATLCINLNQFRIRATYKTTLFNSRLHCNIVARIVATRVARSTSVILPEMKMSLNVFFLFCNKHYTKQNQVLLFAKITAAKMLRDMFISRGY